MKFLYLITLVLLCPTLQADCPENFIKISSWNIRDLGQSKNENEMKFIADIIKDSDVIAIQEVVASDEGVKAVKRLLNVLKQNNERWRAVVSNRTTGDGVERYAYLYNSVHVKTKNSSSNGLNQKLESTIDREPYLQTFSFNGQDVHFASFHAVPTKKRPAHEIIQLQNIDIFKKDESSILMGDFNLGYRSKAFDSLRNLGLASHIRGKTALKLKRKDGKHLTHPYDNVFTKKLNVCDAGITDFSYGFETLKQARYISDHLPIWIKIPR